jgi:hypothetical protein
MVKYECKACNYKTTRLSNWRQHIKTDKHLRHSFICKHCGKEYKYRSGLSKHMNNCKEEKNIVVNNTIINNYNNITFQVFLDNNCKNAIDIDDLLDRLMFSKKELLKMANNKSQSESLKYMITNNLKKLDVYDRPIHCSDLEKKDFFIKNKNIWKKDDGGEEIGRFIEKVNQNGIKSVMKCMQENKFNDDDLVKTEKVIKYLTTEPIPGKRELVENIAENTHIDLNDNCDLKNKTDLKIGD